MFIYANLLLIRVDDPTFGRAFIDLAEVDPVAAKAVLRLADLDRDGAQVVSAPHVVFREGEPASVLVAGNWSIELALHAPPDASTMSVQVTLESEEWTDTPLTWTGAVPLGDALATWTVSSGWMLAVESSGAPDAETAGMWLQESQHRVNALLETYDTTSRRARSRAVADLLESP